MKKTVAVLSFTLLIAGVGISGARAHDSSTAPSSNGAAPKSAHDGMGDMKGMKMDGMSKKDGGDKMAPAKTGEGKRKMETSK